MQEYGMKYVEETDIQLNCQAEKDIAESRHQ